MQAIILAAGMGKRLKDLTANNTKCMVQVNGITLIQRMLSQLDHLKLNRIVIVVGYEGQKLMDFIATLKIRTPIVYINNPIFDKTNNIYSLALAKEELEQDDTLLLESDIIFEDSVLEVLLDDPRETLALVDKFESWMDGTVVKLNETDAILDFVPGKKFVFDDIPLYYKTVNIYKFSRQFSKTHYVPFLTAYSKALGDNEYYEQVLRVITMLDDPEIKAKRLDNQLWYEIDDMQDLDIASSMFASDDDDKVDRICARYGGYWRYPKMLDFCYLVNPYFPPRRMMDEMKANFEVLLTQYPSGMRVNSLLAARNFGVRQEHIVVGNGAAELIKSLMSRLEGKVGFIRPTFEEYPNRYPQENSVIFTPGNENFTYTVEELISFFEDSGVTAVTLINPDNPSGNYLSKMELVRFIGWAKEKNILAVIDESFSDFADEPNNSLLDEEILALYDGLVVVKSISKSYGVPGIRLGVLASGNETLISDLKKDVAIWNINSFGEFYLQIEGKYKNDYQKAMTKFRAAREIYLNELRKISGLRVVPTQANYVVVELLNGMSAKELTRKLLVEHDILVKDLSAKIKMNHRQFLRLAVRDEKDNAALVTAILECLRK